MNCIFMITLFYYINLSIDYQHCYLTIGKKLLIPLLCETASESLACLCFMNNAKVHRASSFVHTITIFPCPIQYWSIVISN